MRLSAAHLSRPWSFRRHETAEMQERARHKCSAIGNYQTVIDVRSPPPQDGISAGHIDRPRLERVGRPAEE